MQQSIGNDRFALYIHIRFTLVLAPDRITTMRLPTIILISALLLCWATLGHALDSNKITINGYTSFEVEKQVDGQGKGGGDPHLSFDADLFDLVVNFQVSDQVRAAADFTWEHGVASEDDRGNAALEYGFVEHTFSDLFKIRVGKMFTPFGIFNEIHTAKTAFLSVKEAASTNKPERIVEGAFRFFPRWGVGIALRGDGRRSSQLFCRDDPQPEGDYGLQILRRQ